MRYINTIDTSKVEISTKLPKNLELGDLTIFIGESNTGKTRVLNFIHLTLQVSSFEDFADTYKSKGITIPEGLKIPRPFNVGYYPILNRDQVNRFDGRGATLSEVGGSLKHLDSNIKDLGNDDLEFRDGRTHELIHQGSGVHSMLNLYKHMSNSHFFIIDEPENSLYPNGKIKLLKTLISKTERMQIIIATHDPTLINSYLIKKIIKEKERKVMIYSASNNKFKKIDFESKKITPEIHAGYLTQAYSSKPVHLYLEGQTDYYVFQALLPKFCMMKKINKISYTISRIAVFYMGGGQWENHIYHLPDSKYFKTIMLLDGEYEEKVKELGEEFHIVRKELDFVKNKPNICTFTKEGIEHVFEGIFGDNLESDKYKLSEYIWNLPQDQFEKIWEKHKEDVDIKKIEKILDWIINETKT